MAPPAVLDILATPRPESRSGPLRLVDQSARPRYDVSPVFADASALADLCGAILARFPQEEFDAVVALDALGFVLGGAVAARAGRGLVVARKAGKLPLDASRLLRSAEFDDYDGARKSFEMRADLLPRGTRALVVDEWIGGGAQVHAVLGALEGAGVSVAGVAVLYLHPDIEAALDVARRYPTWCANCLVCKYFLCVCHTGGEGDPFAPQQAGDTGTASL
ncbi:phosphoribosyltransferase-like protein [Hyaloraphidium curvatum]|nr:phosphoribosyltransferase-like protein [Hyaloraphidium curvatum]KAI9033052.1 phosphoribosyltransferase-like protein [Hyaloraphidium curvatum]